MGRIDPVVRLLTFMVVLFLAATFCAEWWFKSDAQFFQVISGLVTGAFGALLLKITGRTPDAPPGTTVSTVSTSTSQPAPSIPVPAEVESISTITPKTADPAEKGTVPK
jgi:hypothetical protein